MGGRGKSSGIGYKEYAGSQNKNPNSITNNSKSNGIGNEPYTGIRNLENDFRNGKGERTLTIHYNEHGSKVNATNETDYLNKARDFLERPLTPEIESFTTKQGTYFRYNKQTNEFGIINEYGGISTYFAPDEGISYWYDQFDKYWSK